MAGPIARAGRHFPEISAAGLPGFGAGPILRAAMRRGAILLGEELAKTLHLFVEGRVQGVGYREFARRAALRGQLSGWARNRADGRVEIRASGAAMDLDAFVEALRRGPPASAVRGLQAVEDGAAPERGGFFIVASV
jgi:acylphosphatase